MWQIVFGNVPVGGWIIHSYVNCFIDCSSEVMVLPPHYAEVVNSCGITFDVNVIYVMVPQLYGFWRYHGISGVTR